MAGGPSKAKSGKMPAVKGTRRAEPLAERRAKAANSPLPTASLAGADAINAAAKDVVKAGGGFGENKAFIGEVWDKLGRPNDMTKAEFHSILWDLHRRGEISLSRADLVEAMDPKLVDRSEMHPPGLSATYHFVRVR